MDNSKQQDAQVVLIIDDEQTNLNVMIDTLKTAGLDPITARNGEMGVKRAIFSHPDLILLDVMMPGIDGFETCRRLKTDTQTRDIPVIFMTALTDVSNKLRAFEAGGVDYITKPFEEQEVLMRVRTHLTLRRIQTSLEQEIAERQRAQEQLWKLYRAVESSASSIVITDTDGTIEFVNPAFCQITGYTREEAIGLNPRVLQSGQHPTDFYEELWRTITSGGTWRGEFINKRKDGSLYWESASITPVKDLNGRLTHYVAVKEDITRQKEAEDKLKRLNAELISAKEKAETANQAKSAFLANMSHELRTPLNAIIGFSEIIAHNPEVPSEEQGNLAIIQRSGNHLLTLINQVLDFSKVEAGHFTVQEKAFDLSHLLAEIHDMFSLKARQKGVALSIDSASEVPRYVRTDDVKLRQILINLLNNAMKFTQEGGITVKLDYGRVNLANWTKDADALHSSIGRLHVSISDTGAGIAPEEMESLFEAFVQTETGRQAQEGTGLGLAISRKFVHLLGGDITATSEVGHGTTFRFDIQVAVVDETEVERPRPIRRAIALEPRQSQYRLLIVDDKPDNRALLVKLLTPFGFELREAANGQEAVGVWNEWNPHLIWMDLRMPVMGGYEATQQIRALERQKGQGEGQKQDSARPSPFVFRPVSIIALSAGSFEDEQTVALANGCDDFLRKPLHEADLFDLMQKHLGLRFVYEEGQQAADHQQQAQELTPEAVAVLPSEVLAQIKNATEVCDIAALTQLFTDMHPHHPALAETFIRLTENFEYETILHAIRKSSSS